MAINKRLFQKLLGFCLFLLVINTNAQVNELPEDKTKEIKKGFKAKNSLIVSLSIALSMELIHKQMLSKIIKHFT